MDSGSEPGIYDLAPLPYPPDNDGGKASQAMFVCPRDLEITDNEHLELHTNAFFENYLQGLISVEDIMTHLQKNYSEASIAKLVEKSLLTCLNRQPPAHNNMGVLLAALIDFDIIPNSVLIKALAHMYDIMDDIAIIVPNVWELQARVVVPLISADKFNFGYFKEVVRKTNSISKIILPILQVVRMNKGEEFVKGKFWNLPIEIIEDFMARDDYDVDALIEEHELLKNVRGILNRLIKGVNKFDTLVRKFRALPINSERKLQSVVQLILKKAVDDNVDFFVPAYADFGKACSRLEVAKNVLDVNENAGVNLEKVSLRRSLISECQASFESGDIEAELNIAKLLHDINICTDPVVKEQKKFEVQEMVRSRRIMRLGLVRFIGELFINDMAAPKIMFNIIEQLLDSSDNESLECLCKLLNTIGKDLEYPKFQESSSYALESRAKPLQLTQPYFARMAKLSQKVDISPRVRFMLRDVIELKNCQWTPRRTKRFLLNLDKKTNIFQKIIKTNNWVRRQMRRIMMLRREGENRNRAQKKEYNIQQLTKPEEKARLHGKRQDKPLSEERRVRGKQRRGSGRDGAGVGSGDWNTVRQVRSGPWRNRKPKSPPKREEQDLGSVNPRGQSMTTDSGSTMAKEQQSELTSRNTLSMSDKEKKPSGKRYSKSYREKRLPASSSSLEKDQQIIQKDDLEDCIKNQVLGSLINEVVLECNLLSMKEVQSIILTFMRADEPCEKIIDYILSTVGDDVDDLKFIHTLTMTVCELCIDGSNMTFNPAKLRQYKMLIMRFVDLVECGELASIDSVHVLTSKLDLPQAQVNSVFGVLIDDGIVSSESFVLWKRSIEKW